MYEELKGQLHDVISGKSQVRFGTVVQAIASYLEESKGTGGEIEIGKHFKEQEEKRLTLHRRAQALEIRD
jgi:hypothetical protein